MLEKGSFDQFRLLIQSFLRKISNKGLQNTFHSNTPQKICKNLVPFKLGIMFLSAEPSAKVPEMKLKNLRRPHKSRDTQIRRVPAVIESLSAEGTDPGSAGIYSPNVKETNLKSQRAF